MEYHQGNFKKSNKYFNSVLIADIVLSVAIVIFAVAFSFSLEHTLRVPPELILDVQRLFILCFLNYSLNMVMTVFSSAAYLKNKLDINYIFRTLGYAAEIISLTLLFTYCDTRLFYVGISYIVDTFIILLSRIWMTQKWTPELKFNMGLFNFSAVKELVINGVWNSINSLGNILNTGLDMLVTNILLSTTDLGMLGIVKMFPTMLVMINQMVSQPFQPLLLKAYSINDRNGLLSTLKLSMKISGYVTFLIYAGFVAIGKQFYELWMPTQDSSLLYYLTLIALLPNALEGIIYPCYYIYTLCVKNKIPCFITIICGAFNVLGMYLLIQYTNMGIFAVLLTTVLVMIVTSLITNPIYMAKCLKIKNSFFNFIFIRGIVSCFLMSLGMFIFVKMFVIDSWFKLVAVALCLCIVGTLIYLVIMFDKHEKKIILIKMKKALKDNSKRINK